MCDYIHNTAEVVKLHQTFNVRVEKCKQSNIAGLDIAVHRDPVRKL
jgi:hypothetical protein